MKWKELKERLKDLPDDADIVLDDGDFEYSEAHVHYVLPPVLEHPYVAVLEFGQVINLELDMDARVDAHIGYYGGD